MLRMLGCEALEDFIWADTAQDGADLLTSFQATVECVERHLQEGHEGPCRIDWR